MVDIACSTGGAFALDEQGDVWRIELPYPRSDAPPKLSLAMRVPGAIQLHAPPGALCATTAAGDAVCESFDRSTVVSRAARTLRSIAPIRRWDGDSLCAFLDGDRYACTSTIDPESAFFHYEDVVDFDGESDGREDQFCIVRRDGTVHCSRLEKGPAGGRRTELTPVPGISHAREITVRPHAACVRLDEAHGGEVYCWGRASQTPVRLEHVSVCPLDEEAMHAARAEAMRLKSQMPPCPPTRSRDDQCERQRYNASRAGAAPIAPIYQRDGVCIEPAEAERLELPALTRAPYFPSSRRRAATFPPDACETAPDGTVSCGFPTETFRFVLAPARARSSPPATTDANVPTTIRR